MNIERVVNTIANNLVDQEVLNEALEAIENDDMDNQSYWQAAGSIVEPELNSEDEEEYFEMLENDPQNWIGFITSIDERFLPIAEKVVEYGY